ncbi:MAG: NapC/NirT family cytochrome c [Aromatoleum sp.]|jgi:cytochrome c-type protein NapC|uniref:NapC/NirT family cytochrome c n=1 Tax=Aromatoleum sp. TaxID=2307007 RepID=UPI00289433DA|nr:NapC/NirT family cytochrome c [Aromatoleum sp.]MDT3672427.1 NapC/NirT family cytochrome c [Aromatoleum sp.]
MTGLLRRYWQVIRRPAVHYSLGFLTVGGFIGGVLFWGGFNTILEATNTETFCIGCHEMHDNVYQELQGTIHFTNRSGVRATCPDCHVPHRWTSKIARKMQASKEVWGKVFGTVSTPEKFEAMRLQLASNEWTRLKANNSLECRNCHKFEYMDFTRQSPRATRAHSTSLATGARTCIGCHVGIAHRLPDLSGIESLPEHRRAPDAMPALIRSGEAGAEAQPGETPAAEK